jgi:hypothetical protein
MLKSLIVLGLGELLIILWLLIQGRNRRSPGRLTTSGESPGSGTAVLRADPPFVMTQIGPTISNMNMKLSEERYV